MIKRLLQEVKEFKKASLAAPLFMVGEVLLEISLPFLMSYIIDQGVNQGDLGAVVRYGTIMAAAIRHAVNKAVSFLIVFRLPFCSINFTTILPAYLVILLFYKILAGIQLAK